MGPTAQVDEIHASQLETTIRVSITCGGFKRRKKTSQHQRLVEKFH